MSNHACTRTIINRIFQFVEKYCLFIGEIAKLFSIFVKQKNNETFIFHYFNNGKVTEIFCIIEEFCFFFEKADRFF